MQRGQVYLCTITLPSRPGGSGGARQKLVVVLQGGPNFENCTEVAVVVASTLRSSGITRPFEVVVGPEQGFQHQWVIDCRWPFTIPKSTIETGKLITTLDDTALGRVALALVHGLQLRR